MRHQQCKAKIMNSEKELINQIRTLSNIKPDENWVVSCKARLLGQEAMGQRSSFMVWLKNFAFQYRAALAALVLVLGAGGGLAAAAQNALPGEPLYAVKKAAEKGMALVAGQKDDPMANLQLAAKRLEEMNLLSQKNLVKNLPAAFYEYKTAKAAAKKEVAALVKDNPAKAGQIIKEAGIAMKEIDIKEKQVYGVLGLDAEATTTDDGGEAVFDKAIVESLMDYFKDAAALSEQGSFDLAEVKKIYEAGEYGRAVDYYLNSSLNR